MKKILLTLFTFLMLVPLCARAGSYQIVFATATNDAGEFTLNKAFTTDENEVETAKYVSSVGGEYYYAPCKSGLKLSSSKKTGNAKITLSDLGKVKATSIVVEAKRYSKDVNVTVTVGSQTITKKLSDDNATNIELPLDGSLLEQIKFSAAKATSGDDRCYISSITVNYTEEEIAVARPTITEADGMVTLACDTEGASIYYTTNGDEPSSSSTPYTAPFAIDQTKDVTVKAIAIKGDDKSLVATSEIAKSIYTSFAELFAKGTGAKGKIQGPITVFYNGVAGSNSNVYVKDATGANALMYSSTVEYENGTTFTAVEGTVATYGGLLQLSSYTVEGETTGTAIEPTLLTVATLPSTPNREFVKLEGVTMTAMSSNNCTISQNGDDVAGRNQFYTSYTHPTDLDKTYDVTGIWTTYNDNKQFQLISAVESANQPIGVQPIVSNPKAEPMEDDPELSIIYAEVGSTVTFTAKGATMISCMSMGMQTEMSNEDVAEGDTYEFTMPNEITMVVITAIGEDTDAEPVSAPYYLMPVQAATFDFTVENAYGLEVLSNSYETKVFNISEGIVHIDFNGADRHRLMANGSNGYELRTYTTTQTLSPNITTISVPAGYTIKSITMTGDKTTGLGGNQTFTTPCNYVALTTSATTEIHTIKVVYDESEDAVFDVPTLTDHKGNTYRQGDNPQAQLQVESEQPTMSLSHATEGAEIYYCFVPTTTTEAQPAVARVAAHNASLSENFRGNKFAKYDENDKPVITASGTLYYFARKDGLASEVHEVLFSDTTGIEDITVDADSTDVPVYNIYGQKVDSSYRGLVIRGGVKTIRR